jgi:hypothetical protein
MIDGLHARTAIQAAVYAKMLRISNEARTQSTKEGGVADTLTNLQSNDCRAIEGVYHMWMYAWAAPLQLVVTSALLYLELGWYAPFPHISIRYLKGDPCQCNPLSPFSRFRPIFVGIGVLVVMVPIQKNLVGISIRYLKGDPC